jgi:hypothetical protein
MPPIDEDTRRRVDRWIRERGLNEFGDAPGTVYAGGTPLFNEATGRRLDRYEYILRRHPDLRNPPR